MESPGASLDSWVTAASQFTSPASPTSRACLQQGSGDQQTSTAELASDDPGTGAAGCGWVAPERGAQHCGASTVKVCGVGAPAPAPSPGRASVTSSVASADLEAAVQRLGLGCDADDEGRPAPSPAALKPQEGTAAPLRDESAEPVPLVARREGVTGQGHLRTAALPSSPGTVRALAEACTPRGGAVERGPAVGPGGSHEAAHQSPSPASRAGLEAAARTPCVGASCQGSAAGPGTCPRAWHTPSSRAALEAVALQGLGSSRRMGHRRSVQSAPASPAASDSSSDSGLSGAASPLAALAWTAGRAGGAGLGFSARRRAPRDDRCASGSDSGGDSGESAARAPRSRRGAHGAAPGSGLAAALRMLSMAPPCAGAQDAHVDEALGSLAAEGAAHMGEGLAALQSEGRGSPGLCVRPPASPDSSPSPLTAPNTAARRRVRLADSDASASPRSPPRHCQAAAEGGAETLNPTSRPSGRSPPATAPGLAAVLGLVGGSAPDSSPSPVPAPNTAARRRGRLADSGASASSRSPAAAPGAAAGVRVTGPHALDKSPSPVPAPDTAARRRLRLVDSDDSDASASGCSQGEATGAGSAHNYGPSSSDGQDDSPGQGSLQAGARTSAWRPLSPLGDGSGGQGLRRRQAARAAAAGAPPRVRRGLADLFGAGLGSGATSALAPAADPYAYPGDALPDLALLVMLHTPGSRGNALQAGQDKAGGARSGSLVGESVTWGHEGRAGGVCSGSGRSGGSSPIVLSSSGSEGEGEGGAAGGGWGVPAPAGGQENRLHEPAGAMPSSPLRRAFGAPRRPFDDLACANAGSPRPGDEQRAAKAAPETPVCKAPAGDGTPVRRSHWPAH